MSSERIVRAAPGTRVIRTVCPLGCGIACGVYAHVADGRLIKLEPSDHTGSSHICARGLCGPKLVYHPDRLKYPMRRTGDRGDGSWERISWDSALDEIAENMQGISDKFGPSSLAWVVEGVGLLTLAGYLGFAGALGGTFILTAGFGDAAGPCADSACYGVNYPGVWYGEDYTDRFDEPEFCLIWGNNPADTEPFKWRRIRDAKERGARIVVIDPRFTTTASKADEFLPIRPGTDAALALGMMNVILDKGLHDTVFIADRTVGPFLVRSDDGMFLRDEAGKWMIWDNRTNNVLPHDTANAVPALSGIFDVGGVPCKPAFQLLTDLIQQYTPERASDITDIPSETIVRLAIEYATRKPAASFRGMGCTRTFHGDLSFRAINTLAAITGNISFKGHDPLNVNTTALMSQGFPNFLPLLNSFEAILEDKPYPIRFLWMARHNVINQDPDFNRLTKELVPRLNFIVVADPFMTTSGQYADIVLPACTFYEGMEIASPLGQGSHNYIQLQEKVIEPLHESKSDYDMLSILAPRVGINDLFTEDPEECIDRMLASGHPSMEGITVAKLRESPMPPSPHSVPDFYTPSGRFEFYTEKLREFDQQLPVYLEPMESARTPLAEKYPLSFSTTHAKYRIHSMYANIDWIRELDPEPVLNISPTDAEPRHIQDGDLVRVYNNRGEVRIKACFHQGMKPGLVNLDQGWSPEHYIEGTHQALTHFTINPAQAAVFEPNSAMHDTLVEVERLQEA